MSTNLLLKNLDMVVDVPGAVDSLRATIVEMALRGDLTANVRDQIGIQPVSSAEIDSGMTALLVGRPKYRWSASQGETSRSSQRPPSNWAWASLSDTGLFVNGLAFQPADWGTEGRPIIRIQNLSGKSTDYNFTRREVSQDTTVRDGDLLVSWSATLDTYIWRGEDGVLNQHIFKVIPNSRAVTAGFHYWLLKHEVRRLAESQHAHGLAMMHINRGPFLAHQVLLPPLEEQEQIVGKITELMAICDELQAAQDNRETLRDLLRTTSLRSLVAPEVDREPARFFATHSTRMITRHDHVAQIREAILDLAVQGRLLPQDPTEMAELTSSASLAANNRSLDQGFDVEVPFVVPSNWLLVPVQALLDPDREISYGVIKLGPEPASGGVPTLRCSDVKPRSLVLNNVRRVEEVIESEYSRTRLTGGEVVINVRGTLGGVALVPPELAGYNVAREVAVVPIDAGVDGEYVVNAMASPFFWSCVQQSLRGIAYVGLNLKTLRTLPLPLPPLAEQRRVVAKVSELMEVCDELEQSIAAEQIGRAQLLDGLLRDALEDGPMAQQRELLAI